MSTTLNVYACIAAVQAELAQSGIRKDRKNELQGYKFRGIDDVYNALAPVLSKHKLVILPRMLTREQTERQTAKGGVLFSVVVDAEFDFVSAADGSKHTTKAFGEAMDSADKATNKAMSAAYKYTAFQTFCIPTEGDNDADAQTHEVVASQPQKPAAAPAKFGEWWADMQSVADNGLDALQKAWGASDKALQKYVHEQHKTQWDKLKAKAQAVDAKAVLA